MGLALLVSPKQGHFAQGEYASQYPRQMIMATPFIKPDTWGSAKFALAGVVHRVTSLVTLRGVPAIYSEHLIHPCEGHYVIHVAVYPFET